MKEIASFSSGWISPKENSQSSGRDLAVAADTGRQVSDGAVAAAVARFQFYDVPHVSGWLGVRAAPPACRQPRCISEESSLGPICLNRDTSAPTPAPAPRLMSRHSKGCFKCKSRKLKASPLCVAVWQSVRYADP